MMKRVSIILIFLTFFRISTITGAGTPERIDYLLSRMSLEEKLGQLMILRAYPGGNENYFQITDQIAKKYSPGAWYFENGSVEEFKKFSKRVNGKAEIPAMTGTSLFNASFDHPAQPILKSITDQNLIRQVGNWIGSDYIHSGLKFVLDPSLKSGSSEYQLYGKQLAYSFSTEGLLPIINQGNYIGRAWNQSAVLIEGADPDPQKKKIDYSEYEAAKWRATGFEGLIISPAVYQNSTIEESLRILHQLKGGADMILFPSDISTTIEFLKKAVRSGQISGKLIDEKVKRVLALKEEKEQLSPSFPEPLKKELRTQLGLASIALVKDKSQLLPLKMLDTLNIAGFEFGLEGPEFLTTLKKYHGIELPQNKAEFIKGKMSQINLVICGIGKNINQEEWKFIKDLSSKKQVVVVAFGSFSPTELKEFDHVVISPFENELIRSYSAQQIFGAYAISGRYPEPLMPVGFERSIITEPLGRLAYRSPEVVQVDSKELNRIDAIAEEAIREKAAPGMQVLIAKKGVVIFEKSYGYYTYEKKEPVNNETIYDLASVTKVTATLQAVTFLYEKGLIDINKKLSNYLPELKGTNKEQLIIKDILLHQAGLRPWMPFWRQTMSDKEVDPKYYSKNPEEQFPLQVSNSLFASPAVKDSVWSWIIQSPVASPKNGVVPYNYSDIGFYMMQQLAERILNQPLNEFMSQNFYEPLGMETTGYLPLTKFKNDRIAPTSEDNHFRKQLIQGLVHDEGAAMFGGVAGHSGLFSDANDLAKLMQMLLQKGEYGGEHYFNSATIELFTSKQNLENRRGLGWDKPNMEMRKRNNSPVSGATFGHTGFTGTAIWVDPESELVYIFLSNRIHPDVENNKLMTLDIRSRIQQVIYDAMKQYESNEIIRNTTE